MSRLAWATAVVTVGAVLAASGQRPKAADAGWPEYGGTLGGQRYSAAQEINRGNVGRLGKVWTLNVRPFEGDKPRGSFEATPVLWNGTLYLTTPKVHTCVRTTLRQGANCGRASYRDRGRGRRLRMW